MPKSEAYNMDALEYMKGLPDKHFSLVIADPPYGGGDNFAYKGQERFAKFDNTKPSRIFFDEIVRISQFQIIWGGNYFAKTLSETNAWIVWDKNNGESKMSDGEMAWTSFDRLLKIVKIHWTGSASLWEDTKGKIHICQKPVALYKWLLKNYAKEGDTIYDPMSGSGSSSIAAYEMGFDYVGTELDREYYEAAEKRFQKFIAQPKLFEPAEMYQPVQEELL
jgi:site-specific DNA-methyltransferase (adenine-specific)